MRIEREWLLPTAAPKGLESRHFGADDLKVARALQNISLAPLKRILITENMVTSDHLMIAQSLKYGVAIWPDTSKRPDQAIGNLLTSNFVASTVLCRGENRVGHL